MLLKLVRIHFKSEKLKSNEIFYTSPFFFFTEKSKKGKATIAYEDVAAKKDENGSESESE